MEFRCFEIASGAIWVSSASGTSMDMSYFWSFILIYGDRDGNLSMLKGRLQVLKQVPCDPPRKFFIIGVPRLHLVQFKHNNFF